ncbi:hypothetical protein B0H63DRAFT_521403 [Podospora didyma]|uniref:Ecp2 effector protein domain-containing protein n=1 Tax=Podospora didyma TaxID=330526 RepID=A0AAE0NTQ3_9PEZI|nr:hypothetical protein B0H63DRAFT_521403 [Podospora didyma]
MKCLLTIIPFLASALAAPQPEVFPLPAAPGTFAKFPAPFAPRLVNSSDYDFASLDTRQDENGRFRIVICSGSHGSGQCLNWGQKGHCWDFNDDNLKAYNDAVSSVYPQQQGVAWTLWEHTKCKGAGLEVYGAVENLADYGFNDKTSAFTWRLL